MYSPQKLFSVLAGFRILVACHADLDPGDNTISGFAINKKNPRKSQIKILSVLLVVVLRKKKPNSSPYSHAKRGQGRLKAVLCQKISHDLNFFSGF